MLSFAHYAKPTSYDLSSPTDYSGSPASSRCFERDVIGPEVNVASDGTAEVPLGPGLRVAVDLDYIESCTETVERIERKN